MTTTPRARRQPQDRRPAQTSAPGDEMLFRWTAPSGDEIVIPRLTMISAGLVRKNRGKSDVDFLFSILEAVMADDELATLDRLLLADLNQLFAAWQKDGATLPE